MRSMHIPRSALALLTAFVGISSAMAQELIQNPFFADNSFGSSEYNMSNAAFTNNVAYCTAFGLGEEVDLIYNADYGPAPPVGNTKIGLHTRPDGGGNDQVGMLLLNPVAAGAQLRLRFWSVFHQNPTALVVGLANAPNSFGTEVHRLVVPSWWIFTDVVVIAPHAAQYLTVMTDPTSSDGYAHVTGFSLMPTFAIKPASAKAIPREIFAGERSRITVILGANAPLGGVPVFITYSAAALIGPSVVIVPEGRRSVTFAVFGYNPSATTRRVDVTLGTGSGTVRTYVLVHPPRR